VQRPAATPAPASRAPARSSTAKARTTHTAAHRARARSRAHRSSSESPGAARAALITKLAIDAPEIHALLPPRAESSSVDGGDIGLAGLALLLVAIAGGTLLFTASRLERRRLRS
jgi:hypothetical protein